MVMHNVVTRFATILVVGTFGCASSPPSSGLSPSDERAPGKRGDVTLPASGPASASAPSGGSCDEKVAAAKTSGAAAPVAPDPSIDPLCQWRIDDARNDAAVGAASATLSTSSGNASPGILQNTDGTPPEVVAAAFRQRAAEIAACGRTVPNAPPILRVRIVAEATGTVTWAAADYRANLPEAARACVENALRGKPFLTQSSGRITATYGYAFGATR